jgi:hypothetical protein
MLAAGALLPLPARTRFTFIALAVTAILVVLVMRLRAHAARRGSARASATYERIARIRASRTKRPR